MSMSPPHVEPGSESEHVHRLVELLKEDVAKRGLKPGDRYFTASEACERYGVSHMTAHRAMQYLAKHRYLTRRRGSGTFVGERFQETTGLATGIDTVHVVLSMDHHRTASLPADLFVKRLYGSLPGVTVDVHYVPEHDSLEHLRRTIDAVEPDHRPRVGFVLIRSSRPMQVLMESADVPAVVFGGVHVGIKRLPWVDVDQAAVGQLMARYLCERGHQRFALLMRDDWRQGDNVMVEAVAAELSRAKRPSDALLIRSIPPDPEHIEAVVSTLLDRADPPTGLICRGHHHAEAARAAVVAKGRADIDVVAGGRSTRPSEAYASVTPVADEADQVEILADLLRRSASHDVAPGESVVLPVTLRPAKAT